MMPRYIDADKLFQEINKIIPCDYCSMFSYEAHNAVRDVLCDVLDKLDEQPTADVEPVRHGHWIECDYKKLEHGFIETYPNEGYCCSVCRTAFERRKMTYKQFCAACGAVMDKRSDVT